MHKLEHFKDKICTIFTVPINRNFKEEIPEKHKEQTFNYFMGIIIDWDDKGLILQQATSGLKSYFLWDKIVSISEECLVTDPEEINKIEAKIEETKLEVQEKKKSSPYVDIQQLNNLINQ